MEIPVTILQQTPKTSSRTGRNYVEFVVFDPASNQQIRANAFLPYDARLTGQQAVVDLVQKGQYFNINSIKIPQLGVNMDRNTTQTVGQMGLPVGQQASQAVPNLTVAGQPSPGVPAPQAPQFSPQVSPQASQSAPAPTINPTAAQASMARNDQTLSRRDINMSRMSAMRAAADIIAGLLPIWAASGVDISQDKILERVNAMADEFLVYITENKLPDAKQDPPF